MGTEFKIEPNWSRSKEQIWEENFAQIDSAPNRGSNLRSLVYFRKVALYAAVAAAVLLLPFIYVERISTEMAEHTKFILPDGSSVSLNAGSELSYKPILWFVSRRVKLFGEAYFEVEKGNTFTVLCRTGSVQVLGTSFNVFSREERFDVACITGSVKVTLTGNRGVNQVIEEGESVYKNDQEGLTKLLSPESKSVPSWINNVFNYNSAPLEEVIREIERQYNVKIEYSGDSDDIYTGSFSSQADIDELLEIISLPFSLTVSKVEKDYYKIR